MFGMPTDCEIEFQYKDNLFFPSFFDNNFKGDLKETKVKKKVKPTAKK